jgi:hypothetical protein
MAIPRRKTNNNTLDEADSIKELVLKALRRKGIKAMGYRDGIAVFVKKIDTETLDIIDRTVSYYDYTGLLDIRRV